MKQRLTLMGQLMLWCACLYSLTALIIYLAVAYRPVPLESLTPLRLAVFLILVPLFIKFAVQILTAPFYPLVEGRRKKGIDHRNAKVSVIIPAWNEEVGILKTVRSVLSARHSDIELVVVNDGSTDKTHQLVTNFIASFDSSQFGRRKRSIVYLDLPNGGKAKAMNQALNRASGEFVVTIDADSVMDREAVGELLGHFTDEKVAAVAGNVIVGNRRKPIELMQQLEYLFGFFFKRADSVFNSVYIIGGAAAAYRRDALLAAGGFDESIITEDIEMSTRLIKLGYKTRYAAKAVVYTEGPSDWFALCKQRLRWKYGRIVTFFKHGSLFFSVKKQHPKYLTCLLLPLAVYSELLLLFEGLLLSFFFGYTIYAMDFLPLVCIMLFLTSMVAIQVMCDAKAHFHLNLLLIAPVAWVVFYIVDVVEFQALLRSLKRIFKQEELKWQKWQRVGLASSRVQKA